MPESNLHTMERRDMIKKAGLAAIIGATGMFAFACNNSDEKAAAATVAADTAAAAEEPQTPISERDKLIINRQKMSFADPANPTDHELKHTPDISFGKADANNFVPIDVILGMKGIIHPGTKEHWIDYLTFYVNDIKIAHIENENGPIRGAGKVIFVLNQGDKVKVEAGCNLHGIWENTVVFEG